MHRMTISASMIVVLQTTRDETIHYSKYELECIDLFLSVKTRYIIEGLQMSC